MSIFGNIMSSVFGHAKAQTSQAAPAASVRLRGRRLLVPAARHPTLHLQAPVPRLLEPQRPPQQRAQRSLRSMSKPFSPNLPRRTRKSSIGGSRSWT